MLTDASILSTASPTAPMAVLTYFPTVAPMSSPTSAPKATRIAGPAPTRVLTYLPTARPAHSQITSPTLAAACKT